MDIAYDKTDQTALPIAVTRVSASEYNQIAGSLMHIVNTAGLTPDSADNGQLLQALKKEGTAWAKPSTRYIELTLAAGFSWYTAPANGMFSLRRKAAENNAYIVVVYSMDGTTSGYSVLQYGLYAQKDNEMTLNVPVKQGQLIRIDYGGITTGDFSYFRFIYDEGAN